MKEEEEQRGRSLYPFRSTRRVLSMFCIHQRVFKSGQTTQCSLYCVLDNSEAHTKAVN
jgi:hypothetical protein